MIAKALLRCSLRWRLLRRFVARSIKSQTTIYRARVLPDERFEAYARGNTGEEGMQVDVMYADAPYTVIQRAVHIHPTVTELIPTMLGELKPLE